MTNKHMVNTIRGMNSCMDYLRDNKYNKQISLLADNIFTNAELEADGSIDYKRILSYDKLIKYDKIIRLRNNISGRNDKYFN